MLRRTRARVGRRGAALLAFAYLDIVIGWSLLDGTTRSQTEAIPAYKAIIAIAPLAVWAALWLLVGMVCAVSAFLEDDRWGFAGAIGVKVVWATGFYAAWLVYDVPRAWLAAATWFVLAALVYDIAGWGEVRDG